MFFAKGENLQLINLLLSQGVISVLACDIKIDVVSFERSKIIWFNRSLANGSKALEGSSKISNPNFLENNLETAINCFSPPDNTIPDLENFLVTPVSIVALFFSIFYK